MTLGMLQSPGDHELVLGTQQSPADLWLILGTQQSLELQQASEAMLQFWLLHLKYLLLVLSHQ